MLRLAYLTVFVEDPDGNPVANADVTVAREPRGTLVALAPTEAPGHYVAEQLDPGAYRLGIKATGELDPETQRVELSPGFNNVAVGLGEPGTPFYYAGQTKVYFRADPSRYLIAAWGRDAREITADVLGRSDLRATPVASIIGAGQGGLQTDDAFAATAETEPTTGTGPNASAMEIDLSAEPNSQVAGRRLEAIADELRRRGLDVKVALPVRRGDRSLQGLTNELVVRFENGVAPEQVEAMAREHGLRVARPVTYAGNAYVLASSGLPSLRLLQVAETLRDMEAVRYAEPNLLQQLVLDQYTPNDTLFASQTYLPLIECDDAWDTLDGISIPLRGGSANVTIAVVDLNGVAPNHPDLTANLTDATSKLVASWDFNAAPLGTGAAQTAAGLIGDHGTQCAGSATAAFDNNRGIAGVAPNCHLIGVQPRAMGAETDLADALVWPTGLGTGAPGFPAPPARPADVLSNSYGANGAPLSSLMKDCLDFVTTYGRGGRGCVVCFSVGNTGYVPFTSGTRLRAWAAYERTIAVGASINVGPTSPVTSVFASPAGTTSGIATTVDTRALYSPYGNALDLVAPSHTSYAAGTGALIDPILSAVRVGTGATDGCPGAVTCNDYASTFGGTSHACPTVAGAAALLLSVNPALNWVEVRDILRATAVQIDAANTNAIGQWVDLDGDTVADFSQWYGYGRLDVNAAVIATRDRTLATDLVVRENLSDTGTVPSTGAWWESPDIWVRRTDDPIPALAYTDPPPYQKPRRGQDNYIFCRVKNIGTATSGRVYVRAMITHFPGFEFRYPDEFTPDVPFGGTVPSPMLPGSYLIGEAPLDAVMPNEVRIVKITWPAALVPPETAIVNGTPVNWHPCLLVDVSPHDGPVPASTPFHIQDSNNIAQRNIDILDPGEPTTDAEYHAVVAGTFERVGVDTLVLDRSKMRFDFPVYVSVEEALMPGLIAHVRKISGTRRVQRGWLPRLIEALVRFFRRLLGERGARAAGGTRLRVTRYAGRDAVEVSGGRGVVEIPLDLGPGKFTPVMVALPQVQGDWGKLTLTQRRHDGSIASGYGLAAPSALGRD